jgi:hypothetical protein
MRRDELTMKPLYITLAIALCLAVGLILSRIRSIPEAPGPTDYAKALESAERLSNDRAHTCPHSTITAECVQVQHQAHAQRTNSNLLAAAETIKNAPRECWCFTSFRVEAQATRRAIQELERKDGWRWGPVGKSHREISVR